MLTCGYCFIVASIFVFLLVLWHCFVSVNASVFTYDQALAKCYELNLSIQKPGADGRTQTLNRKGAASASFDYVIRKFLEFGKGKEILEVGGCYGAVMLQALKQSETDLKQGEATKYVLSDLDERHLFIAAMCLSEKIQQNWLHQSSANQVKFVQVDITKASKVQNLGQYDAVYVGKVFHFFTPEQLELAVQHLFLLLRPEGQIFITALSPYLKHYEKFIPEYERRVRAGDEYPGYIKKLRDYIDISDSTPLQITNMIDKTFLFLDPKTLKEAFERNGFKVLECQFVPLSHKSKLWHHDGREYVILIAKKESD